ncbi:MAG: hypothetical protein PHF51_02595 [Candidatus ainarchaeum sp.]|nr:hypothetical protein [Candidatus ainarchaeum sp.]
MAFPRKSGADVKPPSQVYGSMLEEAKKPQPVDASQSPDAVSRRLVGAPLRKETAAARPPPEALERIGGEVLDPGSADPAYVREVAYQRIRRPAEARQAPAAVPEGSPSAVAEALKREAPSNREVDESQSPSSIAERMTKPKARGLKGQSAIEPPSAAARGLKGQSAMEFLMTYGWAIVIMLAVLAILLYTGVISPKPPNVCSLPAGFSCYSYKIEAGGNLTLLLGQSLGQDIVLNNLSCTANATANAEGLGNAVTVRSGKYATINATNNSVRCYAADGSYNLTRGTYYSGKIVINYTESETRIWHQVRGDIGFTVE